MSFCIYYIVDPLPAILGSTLGIFGGLLLTALFMIVCCVCVRYDPNYRHNPTLSTAFKDWFANECSCFGYEYDSPAYIPPRRATPLTTNNQSEGTSQTTSLENSATPVTETSNVAIELNELTLDNTQSRQSEQQFPRPAPPPYNPDVNLGGVKSETETKNDEFLESNEPKNKSGFRADEPPPYDPNWS